MSKRVTDDRARKRISFPDDHPHLDAATQRALLLGADGRRANLEFSVLRDAGPPRWRHAGSYSAAFAIGALLAAVLVYAWCLALMG